MSQTVSMKVTAVIAEHFDPVVDADGTAYLVPRAGARVALPVEGLDARRLVMNRYMRQYEGHIPTRSALSEGLEAVASAVGDVAASTVGLRLAAGPHGDVYLDLGDTGGRVIHLSGGDWDIEDAGKVLFRRTKLTKPLPLPWHPEDGMPEAGLEDLRKLLNVTPEGWAMTLGWLVAALIPDMAHPVALVRGEQGTGKSMLARMLIELVDPSVVPLRGAPRDESGWLVPASASWVIGVDNVSHVPEWWSDALCRVATGDGAIGRKLYTDSDVAVLSYRRAVILTTIGFGTIRGDLADRSILIDAQPISGSERRTEHDLWQEFNEKKPFILGELLTVAARVLMKRGMSSYKLVEKARMADFAVVLHALDQVRPGLDSLEAYMRQQTGLAEDVLEGDLVAQAVLTLAAEGWEGTMSELLGRLPMMGVSGRSLPETPKALSVRLKRLQPALRSTNVHVTKRRSAGQNLIGISAGQEGE